MLGVTLFDPVVYFLARLPAKIDPLEVALVVSMGIGLFAPPFGVGYYAACAIGRTNPNEGIRPIVGYLVALAIGLIIVATVPWISIGFLKK